MASWMIHLRIADRLLDQIPGLDETAFVIGNIAPDSGVPNADWSAYSPPKDVSHYKVRRGSESFFDLDRFIAEHFSPERIRSYSLYKPDDELREGAKYIVEQSILMKAQCEKYGLPCYETARERESAIRQFLRDFRFK